LHKGNALARDFSFSGKLEVMVTNKPDQKTGTTVEKTREEITPLQTGETVGSLSAPVNGSYADDEDDDDEETEDDLVLGDEELEGDEPEFEVELEEDELDEDDIDEDDLVIDPDDDEDEEDDL